MDVCHLVSQVASFAETVVFVVVHSTLICACGRPTLRMRVVQRSHVCVACTPAPCSIGVLSFISEIALTGDLDLPHLETRRRSCKLDMSELEFNGEVAEPFRFNFEIAWEVANKGTQ